MRVLIIVTSISKYQNHNIPTGLWLSEVTHFFDECKKAKIEVTIASPKGGTTPIDPESLKLFVLDKLTRKYFHDDSFMMLLDDTKPLSEINHNDFDAIYLSGGHGTMYDFVKNEQLSALVKQFYDSNKMVSAVCHGICGLIDVKLSNGDYLIKDKSLTGYSWLEEILARRRKQVPFNLEKIIKERGGNYQKAIVPLTSKVVVDGNLVTGQNPFSSKEIGRRIVKKLIGK